MDIYRGVYSGDMGERPVPPMLEISYLAETITPALARVLLTHRRPRSERNAAVVTAYANDMRDGAWVLNGCPIVVSRSGVLLDGVQRLLACVDSDRPFPSFIARGVDDNVGHTIDQHRKRMLSGMLGLEGVPHARAQVALVSLLLDYADRTQGDGSVRPYTSDLIARAIRANPALEAATTASLRLAGSPLPDPVRAAILYMGHQVDGAKTDRLLWAIAHPESLSPGEPAAMLRVELDHSAEAGPRGLGRTALHALAIKALNAQIAGTRLARLHWAEHPVDGAPAEAFPRLVGYRGLATPPPERPAPEVYDRVGVVFETIDADRARQYLAMNIAERRFIKTHVAALARDIAAGRWLCNAQPICFSARGRLMDGQHRMLAVIAARGTITVPVLRGLPEAAFATYDTQARRAPAVEEGAVAFGDQALATAMANLLWQQERRGPATRGKKATAAEVRQILATFPRLLALRGFARRMLAFGRASVMGYGAFVIERDNPQLGESFLKALETGADLPEGHPVLALRESLRALRHRHAPAEQQLAALLAGWERHKARLERSALPATAGSGPPRAASPAAPAPPAAQGLSTDLAGAVATLRRRGRQQALAAAFGSFALRGESPDAMLQEAARVASEGTESRIARVLAYDPVARVLLLRAGMGLRDGAARQLPIPVGPGSPLGEAFARRVSKPGDGQPRESLGALLAEHRGARQIHVLIGACGRPFGVLGVEGMGPGGDGEADTHFLQILANTLAVALASGRG